MIKTNIIYNEDCLGINGMSVIPDKSIDMILCDLPYGTSNCNWDTILPFDKMWEQYERIITDIGVIALFGAQPFTTKLINSNIGIFKYCLVWEKTKAANFAQAKNMPLKTHEDICIFSKGFVIHKSQSEKRMTYNPQNIVETNTVWERRQIPESEHKYKRPSHKNKRIITHENYPKSILKFNSVHNPPHPTQKPVELFEYLIRTYTNEGDVVLDNCIGSGTTALACLNASRKFIGFEVENKYYDIACKRIEAHNKLC